MPATTLSSRPLSRSQGGKDVQARVPPNAARGGTPARRLSARCPTRDLRLSTRMIEYREAKEEDVMGSIFSRNGGCRRLFSFNERMEESR